MGRQRRGGPFAGKATAARAHRRITGRALPRMPALRPSAAAPPRMPAPARVRLAGAQAELLGPAAKQRIPASAWAPERRGCIALIRRRAGTLTCQQTQGGLPADQSCAPMRATLPATSSRGRSP